MEPRPRSTRSVPALALLLGGLSGAACGGFEPPPRSAEPGAAPPGFPLELVLEDGRALTLERPARRILAGNAGALDLLLAVAEPELVAAVNAGTRPYSVAIARGEFTREVPEIDRFDIESVATLGPDLVLTHAWQTIDKGPFLERLGLPTLELGECQDLDTIARDLGRLAAAVGAPERAETVVADLRARLDALARTDRSDLGAMTYSGGDGGGWSAGAGTTAATVLGWAGLRVLPAERGIEGHLQVDHEQLLAFDPDVLVVPSDDGTLATSRAWTALADDERLAGLRVRRGEALVVAVESTVLGTTSHHLVEAAEAVAAAVDAWRAAQKARK